MGFEPTDTGFAGQRVSHFATGAFSDFGACTTRTNAIGPSWPYIHTKRAANSHLCLL